MLLNELGVLENLLNHSLADSTKNGLHLRRIDGAGEVMEHPVAGGRVKLEELLRHELLCHLRVRTAGVVRKARLKRRLLDLFVEQINL